MKLQKAIILTILGYLLFELIGLWILLIPDKPEYFIFIKASHFIGSILTIIFLLLIFKTIKPYGSLSFEKTNPKYYLLALILGVGFVFFQPILNIVYYQELLFNFDFSLERITSLNVIASILIVPITEELFFRNYMLRGLLKNYKPSIAVLLSSLLFAFIHIPFFALLYIFFDIFDFNDLSFHQAYIAVFGGIISGTLFYKSKSIFPSIIFHMFWNLVSNLC